MFNSLFKIRRLSKQLYPTGRSFDYKSNSVWSKLHHALGLSEERAFNDSVSVLDSILPDNDNFTIEDAERWEQFLGLISNDLVSLDDRKLAIQRKLNHPGTIQARQSKDYIQSQLDAAGFNVVIHENTGGLSPADLISLPLNFGQMGEVEMGVDEMGSAISYYPNLFTISEMGEFEMGGIEMNEIQYNNILANSIDEIKDSNFDIGGNYFHTFVIGGQNIGEFADVDSNRIDEFRQLLLKIKPVKTVGILFINYI